MPPTPHALLCPDCSAPMVLKQSRYGPFYGCSMWKQTGCRGAHGAHPDGSPLGIPANRTTRLARVDAHASFDRLWQNAPSKRRSRKRQRMYAQLREHMGLTREACHIGSMSIEQCAIVRAWADSKLRVRKAGVAAPESRNASP